MTDRELLNLCIGALEQIASNGNIALSQPASEQTRYIQETICFAERMAAETANNKA